MGRALLRATAGEEVQAQPAGERGPFHLLSCIAGWLRNGHQHPEPCLRPSLLGGGWGWGAPAGSCSSPRTSTTGPVGHPPAFPEPFPADSPRSLPQPSWGQRGGEEASSGPRNALLGCQGGQRSSELLLLWRYDQEVNCPRA